ncbi:PHB depolymerase family esterase [Burkholderia multivorans]|uniref:extracellular catalytic domain type 1 short-chain-length polyhydroxyalkanoate depolymerase n=1 Tax=Burkholderia multivorans TaxID=87883 RepID=UPI000277C93E|nr:PHB depolymerase family esterase [Burkholderia multivorans]AJY14857.1 esterase, PHB depolymerase family protein [Burkholderia multivorans ATCC BAA-247]AVR20153.1 esterase [Burkholderia multivorans]EJO62511.1 esterase, PHB depolymerase family [Burkholderia multivorans ATCC BAA-247]MBU9494785.1 PHB depolymerase family esterase [Burkholderia multivorans]MCO1437427.1 PHB depolymerase family esterase [Burkholderia multivorans]
MPRKKSGVRLWPFDLRGIATAARPKKKPARPATSVARVGAVRTAKRAAAAPAARTSVRDAPGTWLRSFHSARPAAGQLINHLAYALYLPASAAAAAGPTRGAMPLVVMLHGCKQTAESFAAGTRICRVAERAGFAVLFPEQAKTAHAQRCWNWHGDASQSEAPAIASLIDAVARERAIDRDRIYLAGMSAGAGLAARLAIRYPDLFAAVGLHSGPAIAPPLSTMAAVGLMRRGLRDDPIGVADACADAAAYPGMPALIVHGALDAVVADRNAAQLGLAFARLNRLVDEHGAPRVGEQRTYVEGDAEYTDYLRAGRAIVRVCVVRRLAHAWSGGDPREPFHSATGPDATAMFWNFFRRRRRARPPARLSRTRSEPRVRTAGKLAR